MSEPSQLFMQVRLSRAALEAFLAHPVPPPSTSPDFIAWLDGAQYHGDRITLDTLDEWGQPSDHTVHDWVDAWTSPREDMVFLDAHDQALALSAQGPVRCDYDAATSTWTLAVLMFSENYGDFIGAVNTLRQVAQFKDIDSTDHLVIASWLFEGGFEDTQAVMALSRGESRFVDSLPPEAQAAADDVFQQLLTQASAMYDA